MYLYVVRHGHPIYGPEEQLTPLGHRQARALAARMAKVGISKIYSSPLRRARETAEPTANLLGLPIHIEPWTSEDVAYKRFSRIHKNGRRGWCWACDDAAEMVRGDRHDLGENWWQQEMFADMPNAKEGYAAMMQESDDFFARHGYVRDGHVYRVERPNNDRIALFCHAGFTMSWMSHVLQVAPNIIWNAIDITHTGVTVLHFPNRECGITLPCIKTLSDMSHIFADDYVDYKYQSTMPF